MKDLIEPDADIETSLKEYGLAWEVSEDETVFYYVIGYDDEECTRFDQASFENDLDVEKYFDWVNFDDIANFTGQDLDEWRLIPLTSKIHDLLGYYETMNIFGESYTEGISYQEVLDN